MNKEFWKSKLLTFLEEDKMLGPDVYHLKDERMKVAFWFDGGLKIIGKQDALALNFKDPDLLILSTLIGKTIRIYRVLYSRLVCFEIIHEGTEKPKESFNRFISN